MATFTLELHKVLEMTGNEIGLDRYPIFDETYREALNQKIIDHYLNWEIGQETISAFVFAMRRKMNEIMPYYNQFYNSERLTFDPLNTVDIRNFTESTGNAESTEDSEQNSTSKSESSSVASNFPQVRMGGDKDYATTGQDNAAATVADSAGKGSSKTAQDGTTDSLTTGFQGNRSALLQDYRQTFLNIDMLVIAELEECFMQVWTSGDSFSERNNYVGYYGWGFPY